MIGGLLIGVGGLVDSRALGVGYDTIHAELLGQLAVERLGRPVRRQARHLVGSARQRDQRRHPRPDHDDGGCHRRHPWPRPARCDPRGLGPPRTGRGHGGGHPLALHRHHLRLRAHPRPEQPARSAGGGHRRPPRQCAGAEAVDPDRESGPPRLPRHARVRRRPARSHLRPRGHGHRRLHRRTRPDRRSELYTAWPKARPNAASASTQSSTTARSGRRSCPGPPSWRQGPAAPPSATP